MPLFVAVIGQRNSGKSTIIKSLTGCLRSSFRGFVHDRKTGRCIYVICSSPQEQLLTATELRKIIRKCLSTSKCQGIVMAIQPTFPRTRLSLEDIFKEVTASPNFQSHAFVLDPGYDGTPSGYISIANRLHNFPCTCTHLDGERFSQINAEIINGNTHVAS